MYQCNTTVIYLCGWIRAVYLRNSDSLFYPEFKSVVHSFRVKVMGVLAVVHSCRVKLMDVHVCYIAVVHSCTQG